MLLGKITKQKLYDFSDSVYICDIEGVSELWEHAVTTSTIVHSDCGIVRALGFHSEHRLSVLNEIYLCSSKISRQHIKGGKCWRRFWNTVLLQYVMFMATVSSGTFHSQLYTVIIMICVGPSCRPVTRCLTVVQRRVSVHIRRSIQVIVAHNSTWIGSCSAANSNHDTR